MKYYDEDKAELKDKRIIYALKEAAQDYENGALIEVHDELSDIVRAIAAFILDYSQ